MPSKQSITKQRRQPLIMSLILTIGHIELCFLYFIRRWIVSILCVLCGTAFAYLIFYFFIVLPSPTILSHYQRIPSIVILDRKGTLLYKEWNTQRQIISLQDVAYYRDMTPSKESMTAYLTQHNNNLKTTKDVYWFQKKLMCLYSYDKIATTYMNVKIFQNGVVGLRDASEVYFHKDSNVVGKDIVKMLLSSKEGFSKKNIYARMPVEIDAIRTYIEKNITNKKTGWIRVETSLDVQIGAIVGYKSLIDPNNEEIVVEGNMVRAWTKKNDQLLAARAIIKTKEGGEYNE